MTIAKVPLLLAILVVNYDEMLTPHRESANSTAYKTYALNCGCGSVGRPVDVRSTGGPDVSFEGKVALVTGGASGIGRAAAQLFAAKGAKVAVVDFSDGGEETAADIVASGGRSIFIKTDVSDSASVQSMVERCLSELGGLHVAFNNAGIAEEGGILTTREDEGDRLIAVNLMGVWYCLRAEIRHMLEAGGGAIVNTASRVALVGKPTTPVYSAAKHGVLGLTKSAALEFSARGVRVNAVCPGFIRTDLVERKYAGRIDELAKKANCMQRVGRPEEIAEAAVWLCSEAASFVTGVALPVDGGASAG